MTYDEAMAYIEYTNTLGSVLGLTNIKELLKRLGNPQNDVRVIHIAGTNGKGSICAFLDEILECAGFSVGRYISPTVFTYLERFQINRRYMQEDDFAIYLDKVKQAADGMVKDGFDRPTSFETETAVAFCYFKDMAVDFLLLETGMGGLLDATNVCDRPVCTIIASISMDHMAFLGDSLEKIYEQKLGIMKKGVPCVSYPVPEELLSMWQEKKRENGTEDTSVMVSMDDITIMRTGLDGSRYEYWGRSYSVSVPGIYQVYNSAVAVCTARLMQRLGYGIDDDDIQAGISQTMWKGRFQKISSTPDIYVDGAHNPGGWESLRKNIDQYFADRELIYICGVFKDKDYDCMLRMLMPRAKHFIAVQPENPRALDRNVLANLAKQYIDSVYVQEVVDDAVYQAMDIAEDMDAPVIIIFGSLSFIGPVIDKAELGGYRRD